MVIKIVSILRQHILSAKLAYQRNPYLIFHCKMIF